MVPTEVLKACRVDGIAIGEYSGSMCTVVRLPPPPLIYYVGIKGILQFILIRIKHT